MTILAPPRTVDDKRLPRPGASTTVSPAALVVCTLVALLFIALLNCDELVRLAQRLPYGSERHAALDLAHADKGVSHALGLDQPRLALDRLLGHAEASAPSPTAVTPGPVPTPATGAVGPGVVAPSPPASPPPTPPSAAHPLRVYLAGDSIGADVGQALEDIANDSRVVKVDNDARISTGLTRPDYFDWPARLRHVLAGARPPRVVVVMVGENDAQPILTPTGPAAYGTAAWFAEYRHRVATLMTVLTGFGADVYWIGQPAVRSAQVSRQMKRLNGLYASEAATHPGVTFVDAWPLLAGAHGSYAEYLPGAHGAPVQVRWADGVHLTPTGGARVADVLWAAMRPRWSLPAR